MYRLGPFLRIPFTTSVYIFPSNAIPQKNMLPLNMCFWFFMGTSGTTNHKCGSKIFRVIYYHPVLAVMTSFWALGM